VDFKGEVSSSRPSSDKYKPSRRASTDSLLGIAKSARQGTSSPRLDPQDLAYLQQQLNTKDDGAKQLLLKGVDIVSSFISKNVLLLVLPELTSPVV
jgi:hypothetical protein